MKLTDEHLETLSDKVRKGEPIGFLDAIAVINYQENLRRARDDARFINRLKRWASCVIRKLSKSC